MLTWIPMGAIMPCLGSASFYAARAACVMRVMPRGNGTAPTSAMPALRPENILTDLSIEKLAGAVELNTAERLRLEGRLPWVDSHDDGDVLRIFAGDTWPRN